MASAIVLILSSAPAHATKKVYSPQIEKGEIEVEHRYSYIFDDEDSKDGAMKHKFAVGYGVTDNWFLELYGVLERSNKDNDLEYSATEIENKFKFWEQGERWLDMGFLFEYKIAQNNDAADKVEGKLLLEKDFGKFTNIANIILEKEVGANSEDGTEAGFAYAVSYRWKQEFEPGFELYNDFGEISSTDPYKKQKHQLGPVINGEWNHVKYNVGYLFGISDAAPDGELKWILEFEF